MSNHTQEPWRVGRPGTVVSDTPVPGMGGSDAVEYYGGHLIGESIVEANARRIVACVNAIAGVPTEWLEKFSIDGSENVAQENARLTKQRDELLDVLEMAVEQMESDSIQIESEWGCGRDIDELDEAGELPEAILKARALIAKAKGCAVNHFPDAAKMVTQ